MAERSLTDSVQRDKEDSLMAKQPPKTQPSAKTPSDAVQMLKADHKLVKKLFDQYGTASEDEKLTIAGRLFTELTIHSMLEEELFYPAVQSKLSADVMEPASQENGVDMAETGDEEEGNLVGVAIDGLQLDIDDEDADEELIAMAYEEHQTVDELIEQLKTLDPKNADYQTLFTELEEAVLEHIVGEEDVILPIAMAELDVQALGAQMQRRRDDLSSSLAA